MTERQIVLIKEEIRRHINFARISVNPVIAEDHLNVADALLASLELDERGKGADAHGADQRRAGI